MTDHETWDGLEIRTPGDVPAPTPLSWQVAKHTVHDDRLMNNLLPADFPYEVERGTAGDALACIALRESIRKDVEYGRGTRIREALGLGATWAEVAGALGVEEGEARGMLRAWADGQRHMWLRYEEEGVKPFGLDADQYAAVIALCEQDDDQAADASDEATADAVMPRDPVELEELMAGAWTQADESAQLANEVMADRWADRESEMGPED